MGDRFGALQDSRFPQVQERIAYEGRRGPGVIRASNSTILTAIEIEIYAAMDQVGTDGKAAPLMNEMCTTLEEAVENRRRC